ncbi:hypothetical protein FB451DRAFT_1549715 [Mycena latifolia]|nr:hypothetical protein FB451DRAFT_1549715 [Mycena latifolia]
MRPRCKQGSIRCFWSYLPGVRTALGDHSTAFQSSVTLFFAFLRPIEQWTVAFLKLEGYLLEHSACPKIPRNRAVLLVPRISRLPTLNQPPRQKRSMRSSRIPLNPWKFISPPSYSWPLSPYPSPSTSPWNYPYFSAPSRPFTSSPWETSGPFSSDWENSWYSQSPSSTPWATPLPPMQLWYSPLTLQLSDSPYQPMPNWDISSPPSMALAFTSHGHGTPAFPDLTAAVPESIEKIRICLEQPAISYWTKQWGYATAYKRGGKAITLLDVLEAIYNYFQEPLSVDVLPPQYQSMLIAAHTERIAKSGAHSYTGLVRVDVLNGLRVLPGLRQLNYGDASGTIYLAVTLHKT